MYHSCPEPDFFIRCLPEDQTFGVLRARLEEGSEIFADMFSCCDRDATKDKPVMDLYESSRAFSALARLLHDPPSECSTEKQTLRSKYESKLTVKFPDYAIPFPVLPLLLTLADKYLLSPSILRILHTHLFAYCSTFPLRVYGIATRLGLHWIADESSVYLIHPPLHTYSSEQISDIPTAEAYHKLLLLQHHRASRLRDLLMKEELFPHGYGECAAHKGVAISLWELKKRDLVGRVESGTDVGSEMATLLGNPTLSSCAKCRKALTAATEMLSYKCRRVARRIDRIPEPTSP